MQSVPYAQDDLEKLFSDSEEPQSSISKNYTPLRVLGKGSYSTVIECIETRTSKKVAIKIVNKKSISKNSLVMILCESSFLRQLNHKNIVSFIQSVETINKFYLVLELVEGARLTENKQAFNEEEIKSIVSQILDGLDYIHSKGIIHRDLKPDNIILQKENNELIIKIIDFGLSFQKSHHLTISHQNVGTLMYMAPEVLLKQQYNQVYKIIKKNQLTQKVDIWSMGIIMYYLFSQGAHPIWNAGLENRSSYFHKMKAFDSSGIIFPVSMSKQLYPFVEYIRNAINFFRKTVDKLPENRMSAGQARQHPWLIGQDKPVPITMSDMIEEVERIKKTENVHYIYQCTQKRFKFLYFLLYLQKKCCSEVTATTDFYELDQRLQIKQNELQQHAMETFRENKTILTFRSRKFTVIPREASILKSSGFKGHSQKILTDDSPRPRIQKHRITIMTEQEGFSVPSTKHSNSSLFKESNDDSFNQHKLGICRMNNLSQYQKASSSVKSISEFKAESRRTKFKLPTIKTSSKFKIEYEQSKQQLRYKTENFL